MGKGVMTYGGWYKMDLEIVLAMTVEPVTSHRLLVANATSNNGR